jgi:hypothetical protein
MVKLVATVFGYVSSSVLLFLKQKAIWFALFPSETVLCDESTLTVPLLVNVPFGLGSVRAPESVNKPEVTGGNGAVDRSSCVPVPVFVKPPAAPRSW